jgi:hypothetical protein
VADLLWRVALDHAADLNRARTPKLGTRALDVLPVASALALIAGQAGVRAVTELLSPF